MIFDPDKVESLVPECCGMDEADEGQIERGAAYVRRSDYDQLLALYLHIAERVSELPGGIDDLPEVRKLL